MSEMNPIRSSITSGRGRVACAAFGLCLPLLLLVGCGNDSEPPGDVSAKHVEEETKEAMAAAKDYARDEAREGMSTVEKRVEMALDEVDGQIEAARDELDDLSDRARESLASTIDRAEEARSEVRAAIDEMEARGEATMEVASDRLSKALDELAEAKGEIGRALAGRDA